MNRQDEPPKSRFFFQGTDGIGRNDPSHPVDSIEGSNSPQEEAGHPTATAIQQVQLKLFW